MYQIFIVEDHPLIRTVYRELINSDPALEVCGTAASAEDALVLLASVATDLVITDLTLPGMDGASFVTELRTAAPGIPVLIVSAHPTREYAPQAAALGASYLEKSMAPEYLTATIHTLLSAGAPFTSAFGL